LEETYFNKDVEKAFVELSKPLFKEKVDISLLMARQIGNMYCGSLYGSLLSLLTEIPSSELVRVLLPAFLLTIYQITL
jgi:hydroxymethylglutaryl-CoA synthase